MNLFLNLDKNLEPPLTLWELKVLALAKLVIWWRYRVSQAVCQWLVVGVSFEKGLWDAPHFGRLCRPLNGSAMARRRGGAAVGFGPCLG